MKVEYHFNPNTGTFSHISFSGLTGSESCFTLKDAVNKLQIENPAKTFANKLKKGDFECADESIVERDAIIANDIAELWRYNPEDELLASMNVLQLLANSLRLNVLLSQKSTVESP